MKIGKAMIAVALGRIFDTHTRPSGLVLSKFVHAAVDALRCIPMQNLQTIACPDGTGVKLIYTCPENSIVQLLHVYMAQSAGTWTVTALSIKTKDGPYQYVVSQAAATSIFWTPPHEGFILNPGDEVYVTVAVDTSGDGAGSILGRLMKG
jgi:hypothetical protein